MEIGVPTDVQHVAHVTFDRFQGFLGLPVELAPEVPTTAPSASATAFGVSTESMQCSIDSKGNSVPKILLMLQKHLYERGGLQVEGIFRITADNTKEKQVRDQLNCGIIPDDIDVHCLAGLIKSWFRELPEGVLDSLRPEEVTDCETEEDYIELVGLLPSTEAALLNWSINLMADVVQQQHHNKMNEHNVATVFAPNMTQMADPLNALVHAVQVMKFLKTLILRVVRQRKESPAEDYSSSSSHYESSDDEDEDPYTPPEINIKIREPEESDQPQETQEPTYPAFTSQASTPRNFTTNVRQGGGFGFAKLKSNLMKSGKAPHQPLSLDLHKLPKRINKRSFIIPPESIGKPQVTSTFSRVNTLLDREETMR